MSLAIPSSYGEYLFDQNTRNFTPQMICNGAIIPKRTYNSTSTNYINALRGEDIFFLMEAIWMRYNFSTYDLSSSHLGEGITNEIIAERLVDMKAAVMSMRTKWQSTALSASPHDFGSAIPADNGVEDYMLSQVASFIPACYLDTYSNLRSQDILHLMRDVKTMSYGVDVNHLITPSITTSADYHWSEYHNGQWSYTDETGVRLSNSSRDESYANGSLVHASNCDSANPALQAEIYQQDNWIYVADIIPCVLVHVYNSWSWYNDTHGTGDSGVDERYVLVPIADDYIDVSGGGQMQGLRQASAIIGDAIATSGLADSADGIQFGSTPDQSGTWGFAKNAYATIANYAPTSLIHVKYCNLEGVSI